MKTPTRLVALTRAAAIAVAAVSAHSLYAAGSITTYNAGDLFIGFRQTGVADTLAVNLGSFTKFLPSTYVGGTWDGQPFQVQFGIIPAGNPGAGTPVFSLAPDLTSVFGESWAFNDPENGIADVSWAVVGMTSNTTNDSPVDGLARRSVFQTVARTNPNEIAEIPLNFSNSTFAAEFISFAQGASGNSFKGRVSTENSSGAYIGPATDPNNWGARIGGTTSASTFNSGALGEQPFNGPGAGPTDSILDLFLFPGEGSTLATSPIYLGSFTLEEDGTITYAAVPEPGGAALLAAAGAPLGLRRFRRRDDRSTLSPTQNLPT